MMEGSSAAGKENVAFVMELEIKTPTKGAKPAVFTRLENSPLIPATIEGIEKKQAAAEERRIAHLAAVQSPAQKWVERKAALDHKVENSPKKATVEGITAKLVAAEERRNVHLAAVASPAKAWEKKKEALEERVANSPQKSTVAGINAKLAAAEDRRNAYLAVRASPAKAWDAKIGDVIERSKTPKKTRVEIDAELDAASERRKEALDAKITVARKLQFLPESPVKGK